MIFGVSSMIILYILYVLLIKGLLWKIIFVIFGWGSIYFYLSTLDSFQVCPLNISGYTFSWAIIAPTILVMLVLANTKDS